MIFGQYLHLANGDSIEFCQPLRLGQSLIDEHCMQVFQIGQAHKLRDICVISNITLEVGIGFPPLLCGHTKECHVQNICFIGIDQRDLSGRQLLRDEIFLDEEENVIVIYGAFESFGDIQKYLEGNGFEIKSGQFDRIATSDPKKLTAEEKADVEKLLAKLEEDDDVQNVYHTMDMSE